jgi:hypothetical protein
MTAIPRRKRLWQWFRPKAWTIVNLGIGSCALGLTIYTFAVTVPRTSEQFASTTRQFSNITDRLSVINQDSLKMGEQIALITKNVQDTAELLGTLAPLVYKTSIRTELEGSGGEAYLERVKQLALTYEKLPYEKMPLAEKSVEKQCVLTAAGRKIVGTESIWDSADLIVKHNPGYSPAKVLLSVGVDKLYDASLQCELDPDAMVGLVAILIGEIKASAK